MQEKSLDKDLKQEIDRMQDWFYRTNFHKFRDLNEINFTEKVMDKLGSIFERLLGFSLLEKDLKGPQKILSDFILNEISSIGEVIYQKNRHGEFEQIDISYLKHVFEYIYKAIQIYKILKIENEAKNAEEILSRVNEKFKNLIDKLLKLKNKKDRFKERQFDNAVTILNNIYKELFSLFSNKSTNHIFDDRYFFLEQYLSKSRVDILKMLHMDNDDSYPEIPSQETLNLILCQQEAFKKYLEEWLKIV